MWHYEIVNQISSSQFHLNELTTYQCDREVLKSDLNSHTIWLKNSLDFLQLFLAAKLQLGNAKRKRAFGHMRTAKAQISLRIR